MRNFPACASSWQPPSTRPCCPGPISAQSLGQHQHPDPTAGSQPLHFPVAITVCGQQRPQSICPGRKPAWSAGRSFAQTCSPHMAPEMSRGLGDSTMRQAGKWAAPCLRPAFLGERCPPKSATKRREGGRSQSRPAQSWLQLPLLGLLAAGAECGRQGDPDIRPGRHSHIGCPWWTGSQAASAGACHPQPGQPWRVHPYNPAWG